MLYSNTSSTLTVTSVKRINGKAILLLSNGEVITFPRAMLKERPYRSGTPFDRSAFDSFIHVRAYPFALNKAVSLLASRSHTEREIVESLQRNAYPEEAIARVMQRLNEAGYIDDASFAEQWATARTAKGMGTRRIRYELRQKGIAQEAIDNTIASMGNEELLNSAVTAARKASRGKDLHTPEGRQKLLAALARRGFDYTLSRRALEIIKEES